MKKAFIFILLLVILSITLTQDVFAQEGSGEVCLVYFTGRACGDDCGLTDTFMDGLLSEYAGNLISITYYVDSSQENQNVFQAYRNTYGLPQSVPIVLFGKDDYLQGIDDIYKNTEERIFTLLPMNGTNCPLDSGYLPPGQIGSANLPGQPQINIIIGVNNTETTGKGGRGTGVVPAENGNGENGSGAAGQNPLVGIFMVEESAMESLLSLIIIVVVLIAVCIIVFVILGRSQESL